MKRSDCQYWLQLDWTEHPSTAAEPSYFYVSHKYTMTFKACTPDQLKTYPDYKPDDEWITGRYLTLSPEAMRKLMAELGLDATN